MAVSEQALQNLIDKEAIRELVLSYSRAIDRKDIPLLRDLYTEEATDSHGTTFDGLASDFADYVDGAKDYMLYAGHHACNHMISVQGDEANGEVYAIAYHIVPGADNTKTEDFMLVRYIDNYRRCADGKWRFAKRVVTYDVTRQRPFEGDGLLGQGDKDPGYQELKHRLFQRGPRAAPAG